MTPGNTRILFENLRVIGGDSRRLGITCALLFVSLSVRIVQSTAVAQATASAAQEEAKLLVFGLAMGPLLDPDELKRALSTVSGAPSDARTRLSLVSHYYAIQDTENCMLHAEAFVRNCAASIDAVRLIEMSRRGFFTGTGRDRLIAIWLEEERKNPKSLEFKLMLLRFIDGTRPELEQAIFRRAFDLPAITPQLLYEYGVHSWRTGDPLRAIEYLTDPLVENDPSRDRHLSLAYRDVGEFEQAEKCARRTIGSPVVSSVAGATWIRDGHFLLASIATRERDRDAAVGEINQALLVVRDARSPTRRIEAIGRQNYPLIEEFADAFGIHPAMELIKTAETISPEENLDELRERLKRPAEASW